MRQTLAKILWCTAIIIGMVDMTLYMTRDSRALNDCDTEDVRREQAGQPVNNSFAQDARETGSSTTPIYKEFCLPGSPCVYPERVDFRIIVMTYKRTSSLMKLLKSLENLVLDGDSAALEIFIDRNKGNKVSDDTVKAAQSFKWDIGIKRVHVWEKHVGIYGQWIDSWTPQDGEIALILEDDMSVSKYAYRWLKAVHKFYGHRNDISGYTLQSSGVKPAIGGKKFNPPSTDSTFLYRILGSWGYSPHPKRWSEFQKWYHNVRSDKSFHPYVNGIMHTSWYKDFERTKKHDSMWTMWHIWFTDHHNLFCVYDNLAKYSSISKTALGVNREEPGLHYSGKGKNNEHLLLNEWKEDLVKFPNNTVKFGYKAEVLQQ